MDGTGNRPEVGHSEESEEIEEYDQEPETVMQDDLRGDCDRLSSHEAAHHTDDMVEMISHIPDGGDRAHIPDDLQPSSGYHNSHSRLKSDEFAVAMRRTARRLWSG